MKASLFLYLLLLLPLCGCKKKLFDYRNKYDGDYTITYHSEGGDLNNGPHPTVDTTYQGTVSHPKKGDQVVFQYNGKTLSYTVDKKGWIKEKTGVTAGKNGKMIDQYETIGRFKDKNNFYLKWEQHSPGGWGKVMLTGKKN